MRTSWRSVILTGLLLGFPLSTWCEGDETEQNKQLLEKWKKEPDHYARLRQDLRAFMSLPKERQDKMRRLDQDMHETTSEQSAKLTSALDRYVEWLASLPEADRLSIENAPNQEERLRRIRDLRERGWINRLPKAIQDELGSLAPDKRGQRIAELREADRKRRADWQLAMKNWEMLNRPRGPLHQPPQPQQPRVKQDEWMQSEIITFAALSLAPLLNEGERNRLNSTLQASMEKKDPGPYMRLLFELSERHPIPYPPSPNKWPTRFGELPPDAKSTLIKAKSKNVPWPSPAAEKAEGKWPDYAEAVAFFASRHTRIFPTHVIPGLGPSKPDDFTMPVQGFVKTKLMPVLSPEQKNRLKEAEGKWPAYPRLLMELAKLKELQIPGMKLPGSSEFWDGFRNRHKAEAEPLPDVPDQTLAEFVKNDLTPEERKGLPSLTASDPAGREQLKKIYFQKNPAALQRLQMQKGKPQK